ncbi:MAG: GAF domain-containing protein [Anaerolineae bacterium]|nr:GAF domain-containing protein [Anaerolineae bacterium]
MLLGIRWGSLRAKIIAWSFVPTAIILVAVAVVILFAYQAVTQDLAIERNRELTRLSASELATELIEFTNLLTALARTADIYQGNPIAQRDALKDARYRLTVFDAGGLILNAFGTVVATEPERPELLGQRWSDRTFYRQIAHHQTLNSESPAFSDIVADGPDGAEVIVIAAPITGEYGEFKGIIAGLFRVGETADNAFYSDIAKLRLGESGLHLVDGNGRLIYHSDADLIGDDFWGQAVVQNVLDGQVGALRTRARDGQDIVTGFAPVRGTAWGLITEESWAALTDASRSYGQFLLLLLLLGVLVPAVVVNVGVERITNPISELISAAQEVAGGDFGHTITARTGDEIEELAEQFNLMSAQLQESYAHLEQRVAERTKELAALNAIAATVSQSLHLDEILDDALDKTLQALEIEAGGIYLLDEEAEVLTIAAQRGFSPQFVADIDRSKLGNGFSGQVAQSGQPLVVKDASTDPRLTRTVVQEEGLRSLASVPLSSKGKVLGTLFAMTRGYREFTDQDVQLLTSIGHQIGVAIENARLFRAVQRRAEQLKVISKVSRHITSILAVDELLNQLVGLIQKTLNYDTVEIGLIEKDELVFKARAARNSAAPFERFRLRIGAQGVTGWVAATGEPLLVPDVSQDPRYIQLSDTVSRSELAVPIKTKEKVIGVLNVQSEQLDAFDESDLAVLQSLAHQAAVAIENAQLYEAEQRRAEQFRVISKVGRHITSILDVDELLVQMAKLIQEAFNYYHVGIGLIEGDEVIYKVGAGLLWDTSQFEFQPARLKVGQAGMTGWVAATGEPLLAPDVSQEPHYTAMLGSKTRSELTVPIKAKGEVIGVLDVQSDRLDYFDESDLVVLQSLAYQAAVAIENARLFAERERRIDEMAVLNEVGQAISSTLQLDELLDLIHRQVSRVMDATNLYIALYDRDEDWVSFPLYVEGGQVRRHSRGRKAGQGLTEHIIRSRQPLLLPDDMEGRMQELGVKSIGTSAKSWLGVPMIARDEVLGIIAVQSYTTENVYDEEHLNLLPTIAAQAAIALENARLYEQARQLAVMEERQRLARELHDAVTQTLFSASLIAEALPAIWESDQEDGRQLLRDLRQLSRGALAEMRTLLMELRPAALVEANMADLLRQLGEAVTGRTGVPVTVTVEGQYKFPPDVHVALYRIAQEALNNVVKHARASQVTVSLHDLPPLTGGGWGGVQLCISDNGRGFDLNRAASDHLGLGLGIIRERAQAIGASLELESQPGRGTQVMVVWERTSEE